jgi:hypothetical protein
MRADVVCGSLQDESGMVPTMVAWRENLADYRGDFVFITMHRVMHDPVDSRPRNFLAGFIYFASVHDGDSSDRGC